MLLSTQCAGMLADWSFVCVCVCVCVCAERMFIALCILAVMPIDRQMPLAKYPSVNIHTPDPLPTLRAAVHAGFNL